jgi:acid phosphatase
LSSRTLVLIGVATAVLLGLTAGLIGLVGARASHRAAAAAPAKTSPAAVSPRAASAPTTSPGPTGAPTGYDHVVVIVLENHSYESVIGSSQAPYLNSLAGRWSLATGYSGVSHPSLPNYLAMLGGSTLGVTSDCTNCFTNAPSLPDRLDTAGKTWKAYMEGMPSPCFVGSAGLYAQKHDPFIYFDAIRNDPARCRRVVPYSSFATDFSSPSTSPNFAFVTPNLCNDGHDCPLATADSWLSREVPALMSSPGFRSGRSLLVVTFDEGEGGSDRVVTVLAGSGVKQGFQSATVHDHYSLLRTIEVLWNLPPLAAGDGAAIPITEFLGS